MRNRRRWLSSVVAFLVLCISAACGKSTRTAQPIDPPSFVQTSNHRPEVRSIPPSATYPKGGAGVTLWLDVTNPNPFSLTLSTLDATLIIDTSHAARTTLPLGLPLLASGTSTIPIDFTINFSDSPEAGAVRQVATSGSTTYQLDGTIGVDAGRFGQPTFGPIRLAAGSLGATP